MKNKVKNFMKKAGITRYIPFIISSSKVSGNKILRKFKVLLMKDNFNGLGIPDNYVVVTACNKKGKRLRIGDELGRMFKRGIPLPTDFNECGVYVETDISAKKDTTIYIGCKKHTGISAFLDKVIWKYCSTKENVFDGYYKVIHFKDELKTKGRLKK